MNWLADWHSQCIWRQTISCRLPGVVLHCSLLNSGSSRPSDVMHSRRRWRCSLQLGKCAPQHLPWRQRLGPIRDGAVSRDAEIAEATADVASHSRCHRQRVKTRTTVSYTIADIVRTFSSESNHRCRVFVVAVFAARCYKRGLCLCRRAVAVRLPLCPSLSVHLSVRLTITFVYCRNE